MALDWIEADPPDPRALAHIFTGGQRTISDTGAGETWTIIWVEDRPGHPLVLAILEQTSI